MKTEQLDNYWIEAIKNEGLTITVHGGASIAQKLRRDLYYRRAQLDKAGNSLYNELSIAIKVGPPVRLIISPDGGYGNLTIEPGVEPER